MKFLKRGLAVFLAVVLMIPAQPLVVANALPLEAGIKQAEREKTDEEIFESKEALDTKDSSTEAKETQAPAESTKEESLAPGEDSKAEETSAGEGTGAEETSVPEESSSDANEAEDPAQSTKAEETPAAVEGSEAEEDSEEEGSKAEESSASEEGSKTEESSASEEGSKPEETLAPEEGTRPEETTAPEEATKAAEDETAPKNPEPEKPSKAPAKDKTETKASPANAAKAKDQVQFNTGNYVVTVVSQEDWEKELGDAWFEEDGSYTIEIPEENPFFPYEVQFTYKDKTASQWFMTPDDSVTVGGHTFYVHGYFDGTVVTQMSLEVAGETVVVYPEKKEFTNDGGIQPLSLLPLEEKRFNAAVDLSSFTPAELTRVSVSGIFAGNAQLDNTDQISWTRQWEDDYTISSQGALIDLSQGTSSSMTSSSTTTRWQMIVGDADQLAGDNIRYLIDVSVTDSEDWLLPIVYTQDATGKRTNLPVIKTEDYRTRYYDYDPEERELYVMVPSKDIDREAGAYIGLQINPAVFKNHGIKDLKVYEGSFTDPEKAKAEGKDITAQLFAADMTEKDSGYKRNFYGETKVTMVTYDSAGNVTGCLPFEIWLNTVGNQILTYGDNGLYDMTDSGWKHVSGGSSTTTVSGVRNLTYKMSYGYTPDKEYNLILGYSRSGVESSDAVTAAYVGQFASIDAAKKAGAADIKGSLFAHRDQGGYKANYSKGIYFTIFVGEDGSKDQEIYRYCIKTEPFKPTLSSNALVHFQGLKGIDNCYVVDVEEDSYADYSYLTILVEGDTDLTKLAPEFYCQTGINLYAAGSSSPEVSGKSVHDFSKGPVQYTASAEDKENGKNYWLQIVKPEENTGKIYINSLADEDAKTKEEGGIVTSTREMILDGRFDYHHDILLANIGTEAISSLSAELVSDQVELDDYWDLTGNYELAGFTTVDETTSYGELPNLAKLRIRAKDGVEDGSDVSGTLTIKSGTTTLMVLTLTGTIGDPSITTKEIPNAVKYVPYGTMIQNSNKYSWNTVTYRLVDGKLPGGMVIKPNGELYGVPTETGSFTFTVEMMNSYGSFKSSQRTFTFTVLENTDANVDGATDQGYELTNRVQAVISDSSGDQLMVSQGVFGEFVDLFLDGEKLTKGVDYTAESGSTRITIRSQTLKDSKTPGTHTLGIEFRTKGDDTLKRAAQNYRIGSSMDSGSSGGSNGSGGDDSDNSSYSSGGGSKPTSASQTSQISRDTKKGYVHTDTGIITGEGAGYSRWTLDEKGWKLTYADGTGAAGHMIQQEDGTSAEQILWEKVNGSWYAFGANGYLKSGWVYDYELKSWYLVAVENGMQSGWYTDAQDQNTYYLEPGAGKLAIGWKSINNNWYYFNALSAGRTWEVDPATGSWYYNTKSKTRPFGALLRSEKTPDGYSVNAEGIWEGK